MVKRSQTSTEYIVIVAVVIVVAVVVSAILGDFPGFGGGASKEVMDYQLSIETVGVTNYAVTDTVAKVKLRNNYHDSVEVNAVALGDAYCNDGGAFPVVLGPGQELIVECSNINNTRVTDSETATPPISVFWDEVTTSASYISGNEDVRSVSFSNLGNGDTLSISGGTDYYIRLATLGVATLSINGVSVTVTDTGSGLDISGTGCSISFSAADVGTSESCTLGGDLYTFTYEGEGSRLLGVSSEEETSEGVMAPTSTSAPTTTTVSGTTAVPTTTTAMITTYPPSTTYGYCYGGTQNGVCDWEYGETGASCIGDCYCGDGHCASALNGDSADYESVINCPADCLIPTTTTISSTTVVMSTTYPSSTTVVITTNPPTLPETTVPPTTS